MFAQETPNLAPDLGLGGLAVGPVDGEISADRGNELLGDLGEFGVCGDALGAGATD